MNAAMRDVTEFHQKHGFAVGRRLAAERDVELDNSLLTSVGETLISMAKSVLTELDGQERSRSLRVERMQLMVEELGETLVAMAERDEVELADGLTDLSYVVLGTAVAFDIPLPALHDEVHRSNMTKPATGDTLLKSKASKGEGYVPPNIKEILDVAR